jgi:hypothetical protein
LHQLPATVGVDDETAGAGSMCFQVLAMESVRQQITLIANNAGDGIDFDHADWAGAVPSCTSAPH